MQNQTVTSDLSKVMFVPKVITGALMASQLIYLFVAKMNVDQYLANNPGAELVEPFYYHPFFMPLGTIAAMTFLLTFVLPKLFVKINKQNATPGESRTAQQNTQRFFVPFLMRLMLLEAVGIYGLVFAMVAHQFLPMLVFVIPALSLMAANFPKDPTFGFDVTPKSLLNLP